MATVSLSACGKEPPRPAFRAAPVSDSELARLPAAEPTSVLAAGGAPGLLRLPHFLQPPELFILQDKYKIQPTGREVPAKENDPPRFLCEGSTDLPDGCQIDVFLFFAKREKVEVGTHLHRAAVAVKDGRFSTAFSLFKDTNLLGSYTFRVVFDPNFQPAQFSAIPRLEIDSPLELGSEEDARKEVRAIGVKISDEMKNLTAIVEEATALGREAKLDAAGWQAKLKEWFERAKEINQRVNTNFKYQLLFPQTINYFEHLTGIAMDIARCASRGQNGDVREGTERLKLEIEKQNEKLKGEPPNPKRVRIELAEQAQRWLDEAVNGTSNRSIAPKAFRQQILDLGNPALKLPDDLRQALLEISGSATELFNALEAKKDGRELFEKINARLGELLKALQNLK